MKSFLNICLIVICITASAFAQTNNRNSYNVNKKTGLAIDGYDPVAYFTSKKAIEGKKELAFSHKGVVYQFANEQNKNLFKANPEKYEPQYGGWCAYAMGDSGEKVEIDPETFKIVDGKLYLFYNKYLNNTLKTWNKDEARLKSKADINWSKLK